MLKKAAVYSLDDSERLVRLAALMPLVRFLGLPLPDAWIDHDKTKIGYEIPFNRHFYVFKPPRELDEIDAELKGVTDRIVQMIGALSQ